MTRVFNFSAGPSTLPEEVLHQAAEEMMDHRGSGMSVMEMSHRSKVFTDILEATERRLRDLMSIPSHYRVLFLQGGAFTQFAMVPLNLFRKSHRAGFLHTGSWSKKAIAEARKYGEAQILASSEETGFTTLPPCEPSRVDPDLDYVHITTNNTIFGTCYDPKLAPPPRFEAIPLVADMSSNILAQRYRVEDFGLIYAGAQKNAGMAGMTIVIIREDLIGHAGPKVPAMLDYQTHAKANSCHNTPPCYAIYIAGLVFDWVLRQGGIEAMEARNRHKAALLYDFLDGSDLFRATVAPPARSLMNVPFLLPGDDLDQAFLAEAESQGLVNLKGHRSVGGMRASLYNAMPMAGVEKLVEVMADFERRHG